MPKIMIVEDDESTRELLEILLQKEGFETFVAKDGDDFLAHVDQVNPDLVTLDMMMPGPTTREILHRLREKAVNPQILLLTVINYSEKEIREIMRLGHVVDYLTKPFEIPDILVKIRKHVATAENVFLDGGI